MLRVITCLTEEHDLRLVLLAACICALASFTTFSMIGRAGASTHRLRLAWMIAGGLTFGGGAWATHFLGLLAFHPLAAVALRPAMVFLSLGLAAVGSFVAIAVYVQCAVRGWAWLLAGTLLGLSIAVLHATGMAAYVIEGGIGFDHDLAAAALALGIALAVAALWAYRCSYLLVATVLLTAAVTGLHFTAMAAISIVPLMALVRTVTGINTDPLAVSVAAGALLVVMLSLTGSIVDERLGRRAAQEARRFRHFANSTFEGILFHADGRVTDANAAACRLLGAGPELVIGREVAALFAPSSRTILDGLAGEPRELELVDAGGGTVPVELLGGQLESEAGVSVLVMRDLTARKNAERDIERLAHFDPLTGLANRALFRERLTSAIAAAERGGQAAALLWLDIDRFKSINAMLGQAGGDQLLAQVAARLRGAVQDADALARLASDEFAIVQPHAAQPDGATALAKRITEAFRRPFEVKGSEIRITATMGITLFPQDGRTPELLQQNADLALSRAKQEARGSFCFFAREMDTKLQARQALEQDLRLALPRGELELHYQPRFDCRTLAIRGHEALLRWRHPIHGWISPGEFIPLAEECGLIDPISEWVLETACCEARSWRDRLAIAVNLSPAQFRQPDLAARIGAVLAATGLAPQRLEIEVTEGVLIADTDRALAVLRGLKALGVRIALDDFGTGYSSLSYLRRFPLDRIKIDRSFVREMSEDAEAETIVRLIVALGQTLRLQVTAEGVETAAQLALLREQRCDEVQGFLLGRPVPVPQHHANPGAAEAA